MGNFESFPENTELGKEIEAEGGESRTKASTGTCEENQRLCVAGAGVGGQEPRWP